ncbi:glutamate 5-kinase [Desulfosporosinus acidiphilus SJ4]|uniref:Glutamate 5-kinase n=1 Tax=Desulfosporosinus acidiphilus (strain DSM 22704 / JCM 16185 / SJ4) TaxID=646529 RepID=I4D8M0_DESAJ|nr:glutamate 5-kinase [Desulfosporosinus acidiphilus]AFM42144.1 glutamate 5-kinase [Desulfosporosinus acidiphilus SJ4]
MTKFSARRLVLKIGSSSLNHPQGGLDDQAIAEVAEVIAGLRQTGVECVLVTSGAVAAGMGQLQLQTRPRDLAGKQAVAAVGQGVLIEKYAQNLERHGLVGAQVLLSRIDLAEASRYHNAQNTLEKLLRLQVVPIINENDTVAIEELCFGDNDSLSALVAGLVHADLLVILTDVDGLYTANPKKDPSAQLIEEVDDVSAVEMMAGGAGSILGTGGMLTKLRAAKIATRFGIGMFLLNFKRIRELLRLNENRGPKGTYFQPVKHRLAGRKRWIAYAGLTEGSIQIDEGAAKALVEEGKSLLAKGIKWTEGTWERKEIVRIMNLQGEEVARGVAELSREEVELVKGLHSEKIQGLIPDFLGEEVVHRDNMTLMIDISSQC